MTDTIRETKGCAQCGTPLVRGLRMSQKNWDKKKYCSRKCRTDSQYKGGVPDKPKSCEICGKPIIAEPGRPASYVRKRKYCSSKCMGKARTLNARAKHLDPNKKCLECGTVLVKRGNETVAGFEKRRWCSPTCVRASRRTEAEGAVPQRRASDQRKRKRVNNRRNQDANLRPSEEVPRVVGTPKKVFPGPVPAEVWRPANLVPQPREPRPPRAHPRPQLIRRPPRV